MDEKQLRTLQLHCQISVQIRNNCIVLYIRYKAKKRAYMYMYMSWRLFDRLGWQQLHITDYIKYKAKKCAYLFMYMYMLRRLFNRLGQ
jgi:hypothetical protein